MNLMGKYENDSLVNDLLIRAWKLDENKNIL
jgi:hypothetical protein